MNFLYFINFWNFRKYFKRNFMQCQPASSPCVSDIIYERSLNHKYISRFESCNNFKENRGSYMFGIFKIERFLRIGFSWFQMALTRWICASIPAAQHLETFSAPNLPIQWECLSPRQNWLRMERPATVCCDLSFQHSAMISASVTVCWLKKLKNTSSVPERYTSRAPQDQKRISRLSTNRLLVRYTKRIRTKNPTMFGFQ